MPRAAAQAPTSAWQLVEIVDYKDQPADEEYRLSYVRGTIGWIRNHEGVLRAALQHDDTRPDRWSSFKSLARANVASATPILLGAMGKGRKAAKTRAIGFGFQVVLGTLINAILNDPGPLSIHDREMEDRLSNCLLLLLQAEMTGESGSRRSPSR